MTKGDRQPVSFCFVNFVGSFVSLWRLGSLLFPCKLGVLWNRAWSIPDRYRIDNRSLRFFTARGAHYPSTKGDLKGGLKRKLKGALRGLKKGLKGELKQGLKGG